MSNGKTYTEAVLEFTVAINDSERRILGRIDAIVVDNAHFRAELAKGDAKFAAIDDKMDGKGGMNDRITENAGNITKVRNLNATITAALSAIAAFIGLQK